MSAAIPAEQAALLRAIVAHADDDTPRLVYADWLQEHGDEEQAAYIRDSIRLAGLEPYGRDWKALAGRLRETRDWRGPEWLDRLGLGRRVAGFNRGLPVRVTFEGADEFFAVADRLFALTPIRALEICAYSGSRLGSDGVRRLAAMPELARLTDLRLIEHQRIDPNAWRALFRSPHARNLEFLGLSGCDLGAAVVAELAAAAPMANLIDLDLSFNSIGAAGARAILDSRYLRRLELLWLENNFVGEEADEDDVLVALEARLGGGLRTHSSPDEDEDEL